MMKLIRNSITMDTIHWVKWWFPGCFFFHLDRNTIFETIQLNWNVNAYKATIIERIGSILLGNGRFDAAENSNVAQNVVEFKYIQWKIRHRLRFWRKRNWANFDHFIHKSSVPFRCVSKSFRLVLATAINFLAIYSIRNLYIWSSRVSMLFFLPTKNKILDQFFQWILFKNTERASFYLTFLSIFFHRTHVSRASQMRSIHLINVLHSLMKSPEFNYSINKNDFNSISSIIQISNWCYSFIDFYCRIGKARVQKNSKDQRN